MKPYRLRYYELNYKQQPFAVVVEQANAAMGTDVQAHRRATHQIETQVKDAIYAMRVWCGERLGREHRTARWRNTGVMNTFRFQDRDDAFEFKMRFG